MNKKGFTLVELLAVIVILSLVITITATKGFGAFDNTKKAITKENLNAIKEAANVLAEQIDNCDDDIDSELFNGDDSLAGYNSILEENKKNCSGLQEKMQESGVCIKVTVDYLITNQYLSENKDFDDIKDKKIYICKDKESKKIVINTKEIDNKDISSDEDNKDNDEKNEPDDKNDKIALKDAILASAEKGGGNRTVMGSTVTEFTSISGENDRVLNNAPDDYGTSYYFRGNVLDNYVSFADKTWRIVRINGDGSVRLVLDNVAKNASGNVIETAFNSDDRDNAYIGYMYGTPRSTTYDATHENINDSTIKKTVDKWYEDNLKTSYANYLADTLFCNDKTLASSSIGYNNTALGYGTKKTYYASEGRLEYSSGMTSITTSKPTFKCAETANNTYSRFTVDVATLSNGNKTNGDLKYPIGLLTADEVAYAGAYKYGVTNKTYYLYNSLITSALWLSTPYFYDSSYAGEWGGCRLDGCIGPSSVIGSYAFRPSINLKNSVLINGGDGTVEDPYTILTN